MIEQTNIWEWDEPGRAKRSIWEPAHPSTSLQPNQATRTLTHPTFHQHAFGRYGVRHRHDGARFFHEHEPILLQAEIHFGTAAIHVL